MRRLSRRISGGSAAVVMLLAVAACSGDDGGSGTLPPDITDAPTTTTTATTLPRTTAPPPITAVAPTTTPPPPTTLGTLPPVETLVSTDLDAEDPFTVGQQYVASRQRERELFMDPSLQDLEGRVATFAEPGSPYYELVVEAIRDLVAEGTRYAPSEPSVDFATVEGVNFEGGAPYTSAILQTCDVSNDLLVYASDGVTIANLDFDGVFNTYRHRFRVVLTDQGWVRQSDELEVLGDYFGQSSCDPL